MSCSSGPAAATPPAPVELLTALTSPRIPTAIRLNTGAAAGPGAPTDVVAGGGAAHATSRATRAMPIQAGVVLRDMAFSRQRSRLGIPYFRTHSWMLYA